MSHTKRQYENWVFQQEEPDQEIVHARKRHEEKSAYWQRVEWERENAENPEHLERERRFNEWKEKKFGEI